MKWDTCVSHFVFGGEKMLSKSQRNSLRMKRIKRVSKQLACQLLVLYAINIPIISAEAFSESDKMVENPVVEFQEVNVHDPSIIQTEEGMYYVIGSHLHFAKSQDLVSWEQLSYDVASSPLFEDITFEFAEEFAYAKTDTFWASDIIQLADGRYYLYYCLCEGSSPLSILGVAVADSIEGPYQKIESFLKSGSRYTPDMQAYDATIHPNAIDPHVFFDQENRLWMTYGSYSGGIYILELNPETGLPLAENYDYGTKLLGGNHSRIEAPYILYNPETGYYYLFVSYGGLAQADGYNIRVARSKAPDGPYVDYTGNQMIDAKGATGTFFDDEAIAPYGTKLLGNMLWDYQDGVMNKGYMSPGHNSAYYDEATGESYIVFHTRFPGRGETFEVRVHRLIFNDEGWPSVAPQRYAGEELLFETELDNISGLYMWNTTQLEISGMKERSIFLLIEGDKAYGYEQLTNSDSIDTADYIGDISIWDNGTAHLEFEDFEIKGNFYYQWDDVIGAETLGFSGFDNNQIAVWLSQLIEAE